MRPVAARGKRKTKAPCEGCGLHKNLCICEFIPSLNLRTKISLVIHRKELRRTTNTGTLALKALKNSELFVRGEREQSLSLRPLLSDAYRTLLFFPSDDAVELTEDFLRESPRPIQLIVPDGNWRQASKVHTRYPELNSIPRVMLKSPGTSAQVMRTETKPEGMATLQAIAEALGVIEGEAVRSELLQLYERKLHNTLVGRGVLK